MATRKQFYRYVIPSILSFALSGVYAIVDGYFVGNAIGDAGLSAINIAYPIQALIQALGTGLGMGGAIKYAIAQAKGQEKEAQANLATALWLLLGFIAMLTPLLTVFNQPLLQLLGASGNLLNLAASYMQIIALGTAFQILGTGLIPFIRNFGGSLWAMLSMIAGFLTNIVLDYVFVWVLNQGMAGAALATVLGQGVTVLLALAYMLNQGKFRLFLSDLPFKRLAFGILSLGLAPFGLTFVPNISLIIINKFSLIYGGEEAVATYASIAYIVWILYLILQGIGDGVQPLMSQAYGAKNLPGLKTLKKEAYSLALVLSLLGGAVLYGLRGQIGILFGNSEHVNAQIIATLPLFLLSIPFVAASRIATSTLYAIEKPQAAYLLTYVEPFLMLLLMLLLPPFFGGQVMVWWATILTRFIMMLLAVVIEKRVEKIIYPELSL